ncbi:MAG: restriction endonuclease, partial [Clostridia bacterium]|nr:restriction endonuclease [Clostridia bacterium]
MNYWTQLSVNYAKQRNYLDELYRVYPIVPNIRREISDGLWAEIENAYQERDNMELVKSLLKTELFPIKDSYVAYLRKDSSAIERNPNTVNRIAGCLFQMGLEKIYEKCTEPKETNRQIGPMFKRWISQGMLGCLVCKSEEEFLSVNSNAVLNVSDYAMKEFAIKYLGYNR